MRQLLADLFKGVNNKGWELARFLSTWAVLSTSGIALYKIYSGQELSLESYANSMMVVLGGCAVFIASKDVGSAVASQKRGGANESAP